MHIIAFAGQKQSGKSSGCDYIKSVSTSKVIERSFAALLKKYCMEVLGLTYAQCNGFDCDKDSLTNFRWENVYIYFRTKYNDNPDKPKIGFMTAREVMQVQGEMQRRMFCKDIWVDALFRNMDLSANSREINIITDCRHKNEIEKCLELGGCIIHLLKKTNNSNADSEKEIESLEWELYKQKYIGKIFEIDNTYMTIDQKNIEISKILSNIGIPTTDVSYM
ncbi:MAG: hypothetical protein WC755_02015 [Candidatus Woesearchaeota archaeon]|jgi:hypothetical protein